MNENILILGGAGYIGAHVNFYLNKKNYNTIVFDNLTYGHHEFVKWGKFYKGDLANIDELRTVFFNEKISTVIHLAAYAYVGESKINPEKYYYNNVANTLNVLKVMKEFSVKNIIFSSTCATYGLPATKTISESHPQSPISPYGRSKLMVEYILKDYAEAYGINYIIFRFFNAAGAIETGELGEWHEPETHLIPLVLKATEGAGKLEIFGNDHETPDGTCIRDYIHVIDLATAHSKALNHILKHNKNEIFNLGNGRGFSIKEIISTTERITGKNVTYSIGPKRHGDPPFLVGDSSKAQKILGWTPKYKGICEIIETAWNWHKKQ